MLRVITMLLVIFSHTLYIYNVSPLTSVSFGEVENPCAMHRALGAIEDYLRYLRMPLFMSLSGAMLYLTQVKLSTAVSRQRFLGRRARRLLLPFVGATLLVSIPLKYCSGVFGPSPDWWLVVKSQLLGYDSTHLWFLPSLFLITVATLCAYGAGWLRSGRRVLTCLAASIALAYVYDRFVVRQTAMPNYLYHKEAILMMPYYLLGFYLERFRPRFDACLRRRWWMGIVGAAVFVGLVYLQRATPLLYISSVFNAVYAFCVATTGLLATYALVYLLTYSALGTKILATKVYQYLNRYFYQIYLYGDPWSYLLMFALVEVAQLDLATNTGFMTVFVLRYTGVLLGAALVVAIIGGCKTAMAVAMARAPRINARN